MYFIDLCVESKKWQIIVGLAYVCICPSSVDKLSLSLSSCSVCGSGFRLQSELKQHYPVHFCSDDPAIKSLLQQTEKDILEQEKNLLEQEKDLLGQEKNILQQEKIPEQILPDMQVTQTMPVHEKFMITINSVDGNMVAINIEPESSMLKV